MTEPPAKRARRPDATTMWEKSAPNTSRHDPDRERQSKPRKQDSHPSSRRHNSHSRSPSRERRRDNNRGDRGDRRGGGRDRDRDRDDRGDRNDTRVTKRARSRSPPPRDSTTRQRSPPRGPRGGRARDETPRQKMNGHGTATNGKSQDVKMDNAAPVEGDDDSDAAMQRMLGFKSFRSTKNTKVPGNDKNYGVRKEKKTEYRQYMNRQGGFNRPLSPG